MRQNFIKNFMIGSGILLVLTALLVIILDPFYQYHKPLFGLKAVLTDKEYQCVGSLKTFAYDSLIVGSSVSENYNNHWFDEGFQCTTVKAIRSYGATADLCFLMDVAFRTHDLKYIFYNLDPSSLSAEPVTTFESTGCPMYLYDENYLNDLQYLFNKDVLLEKIPYMLAQSFLGSYDEGESYNWAKWKNFNQDMILGLYIRKKNVSAMKPAACYQEQLDGNLALLLREIEAHPETTFKISIPPYSMLWWDNLYRNGETDSYLYNLENAIERLLSCENVEIYFFLNDREIVTDLDNYMDILHFSPEINYSIYRAMLEDTHRVTKENYREILEDTAAFAHQAVEELILPYEDRIIVDIYENE